MLFWLLLLVAVATAVDQHWNDVVVSTSQHKSSLCRNRITGFTSVHACTEHTHTHTHTHTHSCCANTTLHGTDRKETLITARDVRRVMEEDVRLSQSPFLYRSLQHTMKGVE